MMRPIVFLALVALAAASQEPMKLPVKADGTPYKYSRVQSQGNAFGVSPGATPLAELVTAVPGAPDVVSEKELDNSITRVNETTLVGFHPDALNDKVRMYYNSTNVRFASASGFGSAPITHPHTKAGVQNAGAKRVQDAEKDGARFGARFKTLRSKYGRSVYYGTPAVSATRPSDAARGDTNTKVSTPEKRPVTYELKPTPAGASPGVTQGDEGNGVEKTVRFKAKMLAPQQCGPNSVPRQCAVVGKKCCLTLHAPWPATPGQCFDSCAADYNSEKAEFSHGPAAVSYSEACCRGGTGSRGDVRGGVARQAAG